MIINNNDNKLTKFVSICNKLCVIVFVISFLKAKTIYRYYTKNLEVIQSMFLFQGNFDA